MRRRRYQGFKARICGRIKHTPEPKNFSNKKPDVRPSLKNPNQTTQNSQPLLHPASWEWVHSKLHGSPQI